MRNQRFLGNSEISWKIEISDEIVIEFTCFTAHLRCARPCPPEAELRVFIMLGTQNMADIIRLDIVYTYIYINIHMYM